METTLAEQSLRATQAWVEHFVVGLNLCPFARTPLRQGRIRFVPVGGTDQELFLRHVLQEANRLATTPASTTETTLLVFYEGLEDFLEFYDFAGLAENLLAEVNLEGILQVATFHPHYQFDGTHPGDVENYTNRSPFPLLHLIREASIDAGLELFADPDLIPLRNIQLMKDMGKGAIRDYWEQNAINPWPGKE
ncbi:MAG: DUF1415 domain-containing protein [Lewinellaceae bacterium]|nr:DUF1415 domain-containing protein [Lewinellaceae bacterium]